MAQHDLSHLPPFTYIGRVNCVTGQGAAARHQIWMLRKYGLRLKIVDSGSCADPDPQAQSELVQSCRKSSPGVETTAGTIIHMGPHCTAPFRRRGPKPQVLVFPWETTRLPKAWVPIAESYDQVWCPTQWQLEVCVSSGVDRSRLRHVPFALDPALYPREGPGLPEVMRLREKGYFVFGAMFQWTERKAPELLIKTFLRAFTNNERVVLVVKSYEGDDPKTSVAEKVFALVKARTGRRPRVIPITQNLTHAEVLAFYRSIDCYVSTHRGEGHGLGVHEALLLGTPVIATDWSAPAEWAKGCYAPVAYTLEPPHSMTWQPFYTPDQRWAAPDARSLTTWMHKALAREVRWPEAAVVDRLHGLMPRAAEAARVALEELVR